MRTERATETTQPRHSSAVGSDVDPDRPAVTAGVARDETGKATADLGADPFTADLSRHGVGGLVARHPAWAAVLDHLGIDYCCHGALPLDEACAAAGVDVELVVDELRAAAPVADACPSLLGLDAAAMIDHVVTVHHAFCHRELPRLAELVAKVAVVHGARHGELAEVRLTFDQLHDELTAHLAEEERVVFPLSLALSGGDRRATGTADGDEGGDGLGQRLRVLLAEHDAAGELLARLRELTAGYRLPADACASYAGMLRGLQEFEADLHRHVHEENNVLFPAVLARAERPDRRG